MKIIYLLFAVVFLVLQGVPEFSKAQKLSKRCKLRGGFCSFLTCPFKTIRIGRCSNLALFCCQR
ncbi:gallinacin-5-like [Malaclemys terrapin pileata]|uniref:Beta-defensin-like domain-containing protein n=1 Tax=Chrysemys picta bellii TaxID=8478 RepID=A0A8C3H9H5_CHRPI|nr:gallinacin-5-like [Malaclemys terrapin pileata]